MNMNMLVGMAFYTSFVVTERLTGGKCYNKLELSECDFFGPQNKSTFICDKDHSNTRQINVSYIQHERVYSLKVLTSLLQNCYGSCLAISVTNTSRGITELIQSNSSHFIYPVLGRSDATTMYGYRFVPIIRAPSLFYITHKRHYVLREMIISCLGMWPLLLTSLLLVSISGFLCWAMETWGNREEFPRPFLSGWFEGFWWSFISMTTVGYGDKVPKSMMARLFSLFWILSGITIFSLLTAMLTSEITAASSQTTPKIFGSKVGAIRDRLNEASFVAKQGGILVDIERGKMTDIIRQLLILMHTNQVDGFILDKYTLLYEFFKYAQENNLKSLLNELYFSEFQNTDHSLSYGMLVKNEADFDFIFHSVVDNGNIINTCFQLDSNRHAQYLKAYQMHEEIFFLSGDMFWPTMIMSLTIIAMICVFGLFYEMQRRTALFET